MNKSKIQSLRNGLNYHWQKNLMGERVDTKLISGWENQLIEEYKE